MKIPNDKATIQYGVFTGNCWLKLVKYEKSTAVRRSRKFWPFPNERSATSTCRKYGALVYKRVQTDVFVKDE